MIIAADSLVGFQFLAQGEGNGRFYFFIAIVIFFIIRRMFEAAQEKAAARNDRDHIDIEENDDWYDEEMERAGYHDPNPQSETLLEFFQKANQSPPPPPPPPPTPPVSIPPPRRLEPEESRVASLSAAERKALEALKTEDRNLRQGRTSRQRMHSSAQHSELGRMLRDPKELRNAFVLKEILEPPLALREDQSPQQA